MRSSLHDDSLPRQTAGGMLASACEAVHASREALASLLLWALSPRERRCPGCHSYDVRPSLHPLLLARLAGVETWRCRACRRRFPARGFVADDTHPPLGMR